MPIDYFLLPLYFKPLILLDRIYFEIMILAIKYQELLKSRDITLLTKVCTVKAMVFSSSHVQMWVLDHKEGWELKNWYFQIVVLEKTLENPLDCKEIKPVTPKGNQPWIFIGREKIGRCQSWSSNTLATRFEEPTHWKRPWCSERLKKRGEDGVRDGWIGSPSQQTWVWVNSGRWWRTGKPRVL